MDFFVVWFEASLDFIYETFNGCVVLWNGWWSQGSHWCDLGPVSRRVGELAKWFSWEVISR